MAHARGTRFGRIAAVFALVCAFFLAESTVHTLNTLQELVAGRRGPVATAEARPGEIVRVERPHVKSGRRLRFCVQMQYRGAMTCIGAPPPKIGESITMFDFGAGLGNNGNRGVVPAVGRVTRIAPSTLPSCKSGQVSDVYYELVHRGGMAPKSGTQSAIAQAVVGIMGIDVDPAGGTLVMSTSELLKDQSRAGEQILIGIDADGSGRPDLLVSARKCKGSGKSLSSSAQCISYWRSEGPRWNRVQEDKIYDCS